MSQLSFNMSDGSIESVEVTALLNAGYAGRDQAEVASHIAELAALGVPAPTTTPALYPIAPYLAQQTDRVDVQHGKTASARFYDFLEKRNGKWGIVLRRVFYEKDRMDPVDPAQTVKLDPAVLGRFPVGYRNLAYLQSGLGFNVKLDLPGLAGPANDKLYAFGKMWLEGGSIEDARK